MNVLVTVGTTRFDALIRHADSVFEQAQWSIRLQIANGRFIPRNCAYFRFTEDIAHQYAWADVVVTHAGAGSIYSLLELGKRIVIVPNLSRVDQHQRDIAQYMEREGYACCLWRMSDLVATVHEAAVKRFEEYRPERFFKAKDIRNLLEGRPAMVNW